MEEKRWAQRRTSDVSTALADTPVAGTLKLAGVPETAKATIPVSPFLEDEEVTLTAEPQVQSADLQSYFFIFWH